MAIQSTDSYNKAPIFVYVKDVSQAIVFHIRSAFISLFAHTFTLLLTFLDFTKHFMSA